MINIEYNVSKNILRKINENIYYILELFNECCKGLDYETFLVEVFPEFLCRNNKEKCLEVLKELDEYTKDDYYHNLKPIHEYALFHLFEWWIQVSDYDFDQVISENEIKTDADRYIADNINDIKEYKGFMFEDWDFLDDSLAQYIELCKKNPMFVEKFFHIDLDEYLELMPEDIKEEYLNGKQQVAINEKNPFHDMEKAIIKLIYNAIKRRENNPRRLKNTSETELSDDIRDIVVEKLNDTNITFAREMPSGFAKKEIGECDFYLYTYENDIFKVIAIGENKEWGNFENQLMQLIGYMTSDTMFGFTILFNKSVKLDTVLEKRKKILNEFYVEVNGKKRFELIGALKEIEGMPDVLVSVHKNPEKNTDFRIYHFIINAYLEERKETAVQARKK